MGLYQHLRQTWNNLDKKNFQAKIIEWRREPVTLRIERPTRLDRARSLGYKAKQGFLIVRQKVDRGGRLKPQIRHPRRSKAMSRRKDLTMSYQTVAEQRAVKHFPNCEVLNSYYVGEDGTRYWYEVILVDTNHPVIQSDEKISWILNHRGRSIRGLTSSGKKGRGLRHKGKGAEKMRPSLRAHDRHGN